jgi:hypothetical protein
MCMIQTATRVPPRDHVEDGRVAEHRHDHPEGGPVGGLEVRAVQARQRQRVPEDRKGQVHGEHDVVDVVKARLRKKEASTGEVQSGTHLS